MKKLSWHNRRRACVAMSVSSCFRPVALHYWFVLINCQTTLNWLEAHELGELYRRPWLEIASCPLLKKIVHAIVGVLEDLRAAFSISRWRMESCNAPLRAGPPHYSVSICIFWLPPNTATNPIHFIRSLIRSFPLCFYPTHPRSFLVTSSVLCTFLPVSLLYCHLAWLTFPPTASARFQLCHKVNVREQRFVLKQINKDLSICVFRRNCC